VLVVVLVVAACGRIGFDRSRTDIEPADDVADDVTDDAGLASRGDGGPGDAIDLGCNGGSVTCGARQYCFTPTGMCRAAGTCRQIPSGSGACTDILVCGCDGQMYPNGCAAAAAGQSLAAIGACPF